MKQNSFKTVLSQFHLKCVDSLICQQSWLQGTLLRRTRRFFFIGGHSTHCIYPAYTMNLYEWVVLFLSWLPSCYTVGSRAFSVTGPPYGTACHWRLRRHRPWRSSAPDSRRFLFIDSYPDTRHMWHFCVYTLSIVDLAVFKMLRPL